MRVFITGASGYVGTRLAARMTAAGLEVGRHILACDMGDLPECQDDLVVSGGAVELRDAFARFKPAVVIHLASFVSPSNDSSAVAPIVSAATVFGAEVAHAAALEGVRGFVNAGSYWVHADGGAELRPNTLYAAAKLAFEPILRFYESLSSMRAVTLELTETYGPHDPRGKFLDLVDSAARSGETLHATDGHQLVSYVHIDDVCDAFAHAAALLDDGRQLRDQYSVFCEPLTLRGVVDVYERATGRRAPVLWGHRPQPAHQVMKPFLHPPLPEWSPRLSLERGLHNTYGTSGCE